MGLYMNMCRLKRSRTEKGFTCRESLHLTPTTARLTIGGSTNDNFTGLSILDGFLKTLVLPMAKPPATQAPPSSQKGPLDKVPFRISVHEAALRAQRALFYAAPVAQLQNTY